MLNTITVQGRLTHDPEIRQTPTGKSVTSFSIACERDLKNSKGEKDTDFISCVAWGNTAEMISKWFKKGRMAIVTGRLETRRYEDSTGHTRNVSEIRVNSIYFADSARDNAQQGQPSQQTRPEQPQYSAPASYSEPPAYDPFSQIEDDGDLPF